MRGAVDGAGVITGDADGGSCFLAVSGASVGGGPILSCAGAVGGGDTGATPGGVGAGGDPGAVGSAAQTSLAHVIHNIPDNKMHREMRLTLIHRPPRQPIQATSAK